MPNSEVAAKTASLDTFFTLLKKLGEWHNAWTNAYPTQLVINQDILAQLSRIEGFYQREELGTEVSVYSPVIRYLHLGWGIVTIIEDWEERFLHFD